MSPKTVIQLKIVLKDINPLIWRQIQISSKCTFWDLHVAIQDAMGWKDCHLHQFELKNPETGVREIIGIPEESESEKEVLESCLFKVYDYVKGSKAKILYLYDFGDQWVHQLEFEGEYPSQPTLKYPHCVAGKRACPPEDIGGVEGYKNYIQIIQNPAHEEYAEMLEWRGKFDPERFDPKKVKFSDPKKRLQYACA